MRHAGEAPQPLAHGVAVDPHRERRRGRGHRVLDVVLAEEAELGDGEQRLAVVEDRPLGNGDFAVGSGAVAEGDAPRAAAEIDAGERGSSALKIATSSLPWLAKIRSFAAR